MTKLFVAAALAIAALAQPAAAITFPSLTTIYIGAGAQDTAGTSANTGTFVSCSNVSGVTASVRLLILSSAGVEGSVTVSIAHGGTQNIATQNIASVSERLDIGNRTTPQFEVYQ